MPVDKLLKRLCQPNIEVRLVYEAGPCGFVILWRINKPCRSRSVESWMTSQVRNEVKVEPGMSWIPDSLFDQSRIIQK